MLKTIVVGVDGSATSQAAARRAAELARDMRARLHVVCAYRRFEVEVSDTGADKYSISTEDEALLTAQAAVAGLEGLVQDVSVAALQGAPDRVLVDQAERLEADLIVVGNRGVRGLGRVLGSVARSVAQTAPCDIYVVKTT